jgi:hypothetical protein
MTDLPSELRTLVKRYGTHVLDDADGLRATLDDFLDDQSNPGDVNLLVDSVRFGSLDRLSTLLKQGAEQSAALADVAEALAQRRGGDAESAYWACAVLGYAADLLPSDLIPGGGQPPSSLFLPSQPAGSSSGSAVGQVTGSATNDAVEVGPSFDDDNATRQPGGPPAVADHPSGQGAGLSGSGPAESVLPVTPSGGPRARRKRPVWLVVVGVTVIALLTASTVYFATTRSATDGNEVPLSRLGPDIPFGHFGGKLETALKACGDASIPTIDFAVWNCAFKDKYGPYELQLTEADPQVQHKDDLPEIITNPRTNTIVTVQRPGETGQLHAYLMEWVGNGEDGSMNTDDDVVRLTLYDVDQSHAGAAIFTPENSITDPLTRQTANKLLAAIGPDPKKFPFPTAFEDDNLAGFANSFKENTSDWRDSCVRAFTKFLGEKEHVICTDDPFTIQFGILPSDQVRAARHRYITNDVQQCTWTVSDGSDSGTLTTSRVRNVSRLYWEQQNFPTSWGVLSAKDKTAEQLLAYFTSFQGHPSSDCG